MSSKKKPDNQWIRLKRHIGKHWPYFTHPCYPDNELDLKGAFRVRWPDGTVEIREITSIEASTLPIRGGDSVSGTFQYFDREYNDMELIHELHEIELLEEEVTRCVINPSQAACASA
jgi:hypothetical protein